jgi:hypothetical protein
MKRAERKKLQKYFRVGDLVTWGSKRVARFVVEVRETGVMVDVSSDENADCFAERQPFVLRCYNDAETPICRLSAP